MLMLKLGVSVWMANPLSVQDMKDQESGLLAFQPLLGNQTQEQMVFNKHSDSEFHTTPTLDE